MGLTIVHTIFPDIPHIQSSIECGEYPKILCEILSIPHNNVMDLNNIMYITFCKEGFIFILRFGLPFVSMNDIQRFILRYDMNQSLQ